MSLRVDLHSSRLGDGPIGCNPVTMHVADGKVDLEQLKAFVEAGELPAGRQMADTLGRIVALNALCVKEFVVGLYNLSAQAHRAIAERIFEQAALRFCAALAFPPLACASRATQCWCRGSALPSAQSQDPCRG